MGHENTSDTSRQKLLSNTPSARDILRSSTPQSLLCGERLFWCVFFWGFGVLLYCTITSVGDCASSRADPWDHASGFSSRKQYLHPFHVQGAFFCHSKLTCFLLCFEPSNRQVLFEVFRLWKSGVNRFADCGRLNRLWIDWKSESGLSFTLLCALIGKALSRVEWKTRVEVIYHEECCFWSWFEFVGCVSISELSVCWNVWKWLKCHDSLWYVIFTGFQASYTWITPVGSAVATKAQSFPVPMFFSVPQFVQQYFWYMRPDYIDFSKFTLYESLRTKPALAMNFR